MLCNQKTAKGQQNTLGVGQALYSSLQWQLYVCLFRPRHHGQHIRNLVKAAKALQPAFLMNIYNILRREWNKFLKN
jgi:hypothetical protein